MKVGIAKVTENLKETDHSKSNSSSRSKVTKFSLADNSLEVDVTQRGATQAVSTLNVHHSTARRLISYYVKVKSFSDIITRMKRKDVLETDWPTKICCICSEFCLTKRIRREAPRETVSVGYGERA